jgi:hypothetical protein
MNSVESRSKTGSLNFWTIYVFSAETSSESVSILAAADRSAQTSPTKRPKSVES